MQPTNPLLKDFEYSDMNDVDFSKWLKNLGWDGEYTKMGETNLFTLSKEPLAMVLYRNMAPVNRWIYLYKEAICQNPM